jgi:glycosyltransferase involved in cell wall biosynthesis
MFMKISYLTNYDAQNVRSWSGTPYHMSQALSDVASALEYVGPLTASRWTRGVFRTKQLAYRLLQAKRYSHDTDTGMLKDYGRQATQKLKSSSSDIVLSPVSYTLTYLDCKQPMAFWADATFTALIDYYPFHSNLCHESIMKGKAMEQAALDKCRIALFSSDWAAESAIRTYNINAEKVKVVSYGANIQCHRTLEDIRTISRSKPLDCCKLLFLGVNWHRKGADIAIKVAKELTRLGMKTELTVVGCYPPAGFELPHYVKIVGFVSKATQEGRDQLEQFLLDAHFLILPSRADCTPMVIGEANSFGLPCLATKTGGIPTLVKDDCNGKLFDLDASATAYCQYVMEVLNDPVRYRAFAELSFTEYQNRLNWPAAVRTVRRLLRAAA